MSNKGKMSNNVWKRAKISDEEKEIVLQATADIRRAFSVLSTEDEIQVKKLFHPSKVWPRVEAYIGHEFKGLHQVEYAVQEICKRMRAEEKQHRNKVGAIRYHTYREITKVWPLKVETDMEEFRERVEKEKQILVGTAKDCL
jgi:hypothetical protein